ncbi:hypothetical protein KFE25_010008 [Diacronema lutheri]|uniref:Uncharacterized protein n=1 Tax=Diacronema lutheri TaxID=2081491 RepID=A0A8J5XJR4_DIALT|nr:hypothetical protein KFE25_010008 [Diacronema lutheri]
MARPDARVIADLRHLIKERRHAVAVGDAKVGEASELFTCNERPTRERSASTSSSLGSAGGTHRRQRMVPPRIETTLNAVANMETSSPSDTLSPCSETILRRGWHAAGIHQPVVSACDFGVGVALGEAGELERSLASISLPASPLPEMRPRRDGLFEQSLTPVALRRPSTSCAAGAAVAAVAEPSIRSPLASFGSASNSNTPRVRAGKSFSHAKSTDAPLSPAVLRAASDAQTWPVPTSPVALPGGAAARPPAGSQFEECEDKENAHGEHLVFKARQLRLANAQKDGTVFRLLLGEHEPPVPEQLTTASGLIDDGFFVLPDAPAQQLGSTGAPPARVDPALARAGSASTKGHASAWLGLAAALAVAIVACASVSATRRR